MSKTIDAIYENGVLRPVVRLKGLRERSTVRITLEDVKPTQHPLSDCIGILSDKDAAEMLRIIEDEFERIDPNEWQ